MSNLDFTAFQKEHGVWSDATFGCRSPLAPLNHLLDEVIEVLEKPDDLEEYADVLLTFMDGARLAGFNMDDIYFAAKKKFNKNKLRVWLPPDKNGVCHHVKGIHD